MFYFHFLVFDFRFGETTCLLVGQLCFFLIDRFLTSVFRSTTVYGYDIILLIIIIYKAHVEIRSFIPTLSLSLSFCRTLHSPDIWRSTIEPHELLKTHSCFNFWSRNLLFFFPCVCLNLVFSFFFFRLIAGIEQRKRITFLGSLTTTVEIKQLVLYK